VIFQKKFTLVNINSSRELEGDLLASESLINRGESVKLVLKRSGILGVKEDLEGLGTVNLLAESLANDFGRENHVVQNGIVDGSQGARSGTRLLTVVATARNSQDAALGNENNVTVRELLLKLTGDLGLDLLERLLVGDGNEDNDSLLTSANFNLFA
jgi:hypothetical protein